MADPDGSEGADRIETDAKLRVEREKHDEQLERVAAEAQGVARSLELSHANTSAVITGSLDAIVFMDHEGNITGFNPAAEATFGWSQGEVLGRSLADVVVPPAWRTRHLRGLARYLATGEPHVLGKRMEVAALRRDGTEFPAEIAVVRLASDGPPVFTAFIRDLTERHQAASVEALRAAKEAADATNAQLEAFSYSVAHDLRGPLAAIVGLSEALDADHSAGLGLAARAMLRDIASSGREMAQLIEALLRLAQLTRAELRCAPVDLSRLARAAVARLRAREPDRAVEFVAADDLIVSGDEALLRAMLENLLSNAWKFTGKTAHARVELACEHTPAGPVYAVRDNGAGFDMAEAEHIFTAFKRLRNGAEFGGTGIGLNTTQRIVTRHGGRIWAESSPGHGATFRFTLPPPAG